MVLFGIVGELGSGKTLALTFLAHNHASKGSNVFSNYRLYGIPFYPVKRADELDSIRDGFCAFDELWTWLDSRVSLSKKNRIVANILARSRKRKLTIAYTTQTMGQIDRRVREVTDFTAYPVLNRNQTICTIYIFMGSNTKVFHKKISFPTQPVFQLYNTEEEIEELEEFTDKEKQEKKKEVKKIDLKRFYYPIRKTN